MKVKDLAFFLNKLNDNGFGDVELYTHWEDFKDKYPETPEFHLCLNGINEARVEFSKKSGIDDFLAGNIKGMFYT